MERNPGVIASPVRQRPFTIRQRRGVWRLLRANLYDLALLLRQSWFTLMLFGIVLAVGAGYEYQHGHPEVTSALYNTLQLLIFQSSEPFPSDVVGQLLFFLLPLLGLLVIVQSTLNFGRRVLNKGSRQEAWQVSLATTFSNHVIVCGLGRIGLRVVTRLIEAGYEVVVIEQSFQSRYVTHALGMHVPIIVGDASEALALRQAGLTRARAVIADINNDQLNIEIALAARSLRPGIRVILRAFNEDLDRNLEKIFGPDSAFSHSALAAPTLAASALLPGAECAFFAGEHLYTRDEYAVGKDDDFAGKTGEELRARQNILVIERERGGELILLPPLDEPILAGDRLTVVAPLKALVAQRARR